MLKQSVRRFSDSVRSNIRTIGVVGGGQMGMGIAITGALYSKKNIIVMDNNKYALDKSLSFAQSWFTDRVNKSKLTQDEATRAMSHIDGCTDLDTFKTVDFVIEAVTENEMIKKDIFVALDNVCKPDVILTSNTSSIPITRIASWTNRGEQVCGMHFMNPVPIMKLVEIIPSIMTNEETLKTVTNLALEMGKETSLSSDVAGFIAIEY
eukprot:UN13065